MWNLTFGLMLYDFLILNNNTISIQSKLNGLRSSWLISKSIYHYRIKVFPQKFRENSKANSVQYFS